MIQALSGAGSEQVNLLYRCLKLQIIKVNCSKKTKMFRPHFYMTVSYTSQLVQTFNGET